MNTTELDHINPTSREKLLIDQYSKSLEVIATLTRQKEELEASAAVMRDLLETVADHAIFLIDDPSTEWNMRRAHCLSTNAGAAFLARYREMEKVLQRAVEVIGGLPVCAVCTEPLSHVVTLAKTCFPQER